MLTWTALTAALLATSGVEDSSEAAASLPEDNPGKYGNAAASC